MTITDKQGLAGTGWTRSPPGSPPARGPTTFRRPSRRRRDRCGCRADLELRRTQVLGRGNATADGLQRAGRLGWADGHRRFIAVARGSRSGTFDMSALASIRACSPSSARVWLGVQGAERKRTIPVATCGARRRFRRISVHALGPGPLDSPAVGPLHGVQAVAFGGCARTGGRRSTAPRCRVPSRRSRPTSCASTATRAAALRRLPAFELDGRRLHSTVSLRHLSSHTRHAEVAVTPPAAGPAAGRWRAWRAAAPGDRDSDRALPRRYCLRWAHQGEFTCSSPSS